MQIHQFQASFQIEQDRILVRLNTRSGEELRLWLTRRMTHRLFPHIVQVSKQVSLSAAAGQSLSHDGENPKVLAQFMKQSTLARSDFNTPFVSEPAAMPFGPLPLLVTAVHVSPASASSFRLKFDETIPGGTETRSIEITLESDMIIGLLHVLESVLAHTDWGFAVGSHEELEATAPDPFAAAERPKYLN